MSLSLPATAPGMGPLADVRSSEFLPITIYNLVDMLHSEVAKLAASLEKDSVINPGEDGEIHLLAAADKRHLRQENAELALQEHIQYCREHEKDLTYFPFGFLIIHDKDWEANGLFLVHADFEEPFPVTGFRLKASDVESVCTTMQNDDEDAAKLKAEFEMKS